MKKLTKFIFLGTLSMSFIPFMSTSCSQNETRKVDKVTPAVVNKNNELNSTVNQFNELLTQILEGDTELTSSIRNIEQFIFEKTFNQELNKKDNNIYNAYNEFKNSLGESFNDNKFNKIKQEIYREVLHLTEHNRENILIQIQNIKNFNKASNYDDFIKRINLNQEPKNEEIQNHQLKIYKAYENYVFDKNYYEDIQLNHKDHEGHDHENENHIDVDGQENHSHGLINLIKDIDLAIQNTLNKFNFDELSDSLNEEQLNKLNNLKNSVKSFIRIYEQNDLNKLVNKLIEYVNKINNLSKEISNELLK